MLRKVNVKVRMGVNDAEDFAPDQKETAELHRVNFVGTGGQRAVLVSHKLGVGGEVRAELELTTRRGGGETVIVEGVAKLFEGTSESTTDLDASENVLLEIPSTGRFDHRLFVSSHSGFQVQDDYADIELTFSNVDALGEVARRGGVPLMARHSAKFLDVAGASMAPGAPLVQFSALDQPNQRFRIEEVRTGLVRVVAVHSGLVLDVAGESLDDGAPVVQFPFHGGDNQLFRLEPTNGHLVLVAAHSGKVLDVAGVSKDNSAPVNQFTRNFQANQEWSF